MEIDNLVRSNVKRLQPYSCEREDYKRQGFSLLDANENPYGGIYRRYPDPLQQELKQCLREVKGFTPERLTIGNGSDELIDLLLRTFCSPREDNIITISPTYPMYGIYAQVNEVEIRESLLDKDLMPVPEDILGRADKHTKLIFLCTPNNPTGNTIPLDTICRLASRFQGLVVVDEAYIDFTDSPSATSIQDRYPNIVVLQTLSKAWGAAGLRVGVCIADPAVTGWLNKVKAPYNLNSFAQECAKALLQEQDKVQAQVKEIIQERERLIEGLRQIPDLRIMGKPEANFILVQHGRYRELYQYLLDNRVAVRLRNMPPLLPGCLRITVGKREENDKVIRLCQTFQ